MIAETAEPFTLDECRRCEAKPARGTRWVENGIVYFKCDECGKTLHEGVLEEVNRAQVESAEQKEQRDSNRSRYMNEWGNKMEQDLKREVGRPGGDALGILEKDSAEAINRILPPSAYFPDDDE